MNLMREKISLIVFYNLSHFTKYIVLYFQKILVKIKFKEMKTKNRRKFYIYTS